MMCDGQIKTTINIEKVTRRNGQTVETYCYDVFGRTAIYDGAGRRPRTAIAVGNPYFFKCGKKKQIADPGLLLTVVDNLIVRVWK